MEAAAAELERRNDALSLYAALNACTGQMHGKTAARRTSRDLVDFLSEADLARELRRYINAYSNAARSVRWKDADP